MTSARPATGLRAIKKDAARAALGDAARRVVLERGLDQVTVRDIASAVGVSPRTFNNYFSSKEEAVFSGAFDRTARIADALARRPTSEDLWHSITTVFVEEFAAEGQQPEEVLVQARLVAENPRLFGEQLKMYAAIEQVLARQIASRLGEDAHDLAHQTAAAAVTAARVAFDVWRDHPDGKPFRATLEGALRRVGSGFAGVA